MKKNHHEEGENEHPSMPTDAPDKARVIAVAPLIVLAILVLGLFFHFMWPISFMAQTVALWLGALLIIISIPIVISAALQLAKAKTAFDAQKPTAEIVTGGAFRFSRNPTYLSMMLGFLGIAVLLDSFWLLLFALPPMIILQKGVIEPEERYLEQKFGAKYLRYKAQVRRWV